MHLSCWKNFVQCFCVNVAWIRTTGCIQIQHFYTFLSPHWHVKLICILSSLLICYSKFCLFGILHSAFAKCHSWWYILFTKQAACYVSFENYVKYVQPYHLCICPSIHPSIIIKGGRNIEYKLSELRVH